MPDGGPEIAAPGEGVAGVPEELSEEAKQRFAAAAAAMQQIRREEKKAKRRDDRVAQMIIQFLGDERHAHLFLLISRLVARDCPSILILAILSLIHEGCRQEVRDHLQETTGKPTIETEQEVLALTKYGELDREMNHALIDWITRMQLVLSVDPQKIILPLMVDEHNLDGSVLQLATFVLQEFFQTHGREVPFEKLQPLTASILQTVFEPFLASVKKRPLPKGKEETQS